MNPARPSGTTRPLSATSVATTGTPLAIDSSATLGVPSNNDGKHGDVARRVNQLDIVAVAEHHTMSPNPKFIDQGLGPDLVVPRAVHPTVQLVADEEQTQPGHARDELLCGGEQQRMVLLALEARKHAHDGIVGAEAEPRTRLGAIPGRELGRVDAVVDHTVNGPVVAEHATVKGRASIRVGDDEIDLTPREPIRHQLHPLQRVVGVALGPDDERRPGEPAGDADCDLGVEQVTVDHVGAEATQQRCELYDDARVEARPLLDDVQTALG